MNLIFTTSVNVEREKSTSYPPALWCCAQLKRKKHQPMHFWSVSNISFLLKEHHNIVKTSQLLFKKKVDKNVPKGAKKFSVLQSGAPARHRNTLHVHVCVSYARVRYERVCVCVCARVRTGIYGTRGEILVLFPRTFCRFPFFAPSARCRWGSFFFEWPRTPDQANRRGCWWQRMPIHSN